MSVFLLPCGNFSVPNFEVSHSQKRTACLQATMVYLEPKWLRYLMWPWMYLPQVASFFCHRHMDRKFHIAITINTQYRRFLYYETYIEIASLLYYCAQSVFEDISANYGWCVEKQAVLHIGILMLSCNRFPVASMAAAPVASVSHW